MYKNLKKWMEETYPEGEPSEEEWDEIAYEDENESHYVPRSPATFDLTLTPSEPRNAEVRSSL